MMPWTSWLEFLDEEFVAIVEFFQSFFATLPQPLYYLLFIFPALSMVFWIVKYFHHVVR